MSRQSIASCPCCGERISFRKFLELNNLSVINCTDCNARIEIANRHTNALIAGISGILSAASIVLGAYFGSKNYQTLLGGVAVGASVAALIITLICWYAYYHARLTRMQPR